MELREKFSIFHFSVQSDCPSINVGIYLVQLVHEAHDVRDHPVGAFDEPERGREDGGESNAAVPEHEGGVVGDVLPAGAVVVPRHRADEAQRRLDLRRVLGRRVLRQRRHS